MIGRRFYLAGLASILASGCECGPDVQLRPPETCNVIGPNLVDQDQVVRSGRVLTTPSTYAGQTDVGGTVTDIVQITNLTRCPVTVEKYDGFGVNSGTQSIVIGPGEVFTGNIWVPWGDSGETDRRMQILIRGEAYFRIWQKGRRVAFQTEAEIGRLRTGGEERDAGDSAPSVPGESAAGGRRHLYIAMSNDGRPYFKFEAIQAR